ncbi:hypothetical protein [Nonomuraea sp. JJY05]
MKVIIEQDKCVVSGQSVMATAAVFDQHDEDGISSCRTTARRPWR